MTQEFRCDIGVTVRAESPEDAAAIIAAVLQAGADSCSELNGPGTGTFRPAFIGIRKPASEPADQVQQQPADQVAAKAADIFHGIMGSPSA